MIGSWMADKKTVHLQLDQCHVPVPEVLPSHGAGFIYRHVSLLRGMLVAEPDLTPSSIFMIYTIGNMVGSLFTGPICDWFGRRAGMMTGSVLIMAGAIVQTAARNDDYLLSGRFLLGFGVSIGTSSAPTYALEIAPPQWRARVVGYYNTCELSHCLGREHCPADKVAKVFYSGSILATGVAYASNKAEGELAFRLPLALQLVPPVFIFGGALLIPESPRWLTMWGKKERATEILAKYHGGGHRNHPMVQLELREFEQSIELQKSSSVFNFLPL